MIETLLSIAKEGGPLAQYAILALVFGLCRDMRKVKRRLGIVERRTKNVQPITDSIALVKTR